MPACPVCETDNPANAVECARCGKPLRSAADVPGFAPPIDGLEPTLQDAAQVDIEPVPGLEATQVAPSGIRVAGEQLPVERTSHESNGAPVNWVPGQLELERGREAESRDRTPAPQPGRCPWCGAISAGAVCDTCGRARVRDGAGASTAASAGETVLCPACFARVFAGLRCVECGVPLPSRDR